MPATRVTLARQPTPLSPHYLTLLLASPKDNWIAIKAHIKDDQSGEILRILWPLNRNNLLWFFWTFKKTYGLLLDSPDAKKNKLSIEVNICVCLPFTTLRTLRHFTVFRCAICSQLNSSFPGDWRAWSMPPPIRR